MLSLNHLPPESTIPAPENAAYQDWTDPATGTRVRLAQTAIDEMIGPMMRAFAAVPRRGAEIGGFLYGRYRATRPGELVIEELVQVPIRYAFGPSFLISPEDRPALQETLGTGERNGRQCLGFFRSNNRDYFGPTPEDQQFLREFLPDRGLCLLIVQPYTTKVPMAAVFPAKAGLLDVGRGAEQFPFRASPARRRADNDARPEGSPVPTPAAEPVAAPVAAPVVAPVAAAPVVAAPVAATPLAQEMRLGREDDDLAVEPGRAGSWLGTASLALVGLVALLLGVTIGVQRAEEIGAFLGRPAPVLLEVKVQEASGSVQVRWNVDGPAVTQAASGVLYLEAEGRAWTEPLNAAQVARGEAIFQGLPRSLQGRLDLELHDGARLSRPFRLGR